MDLESFLLQTHAEVKAELIERNGSDGDQCPYHEIVFTEIVMQHMADIGMTFDPNPCHYTTKIGNSNLRLSGFALSEDGDQLDLFVSLYKGEIEIETIPDKDTKIAAEQCLRFLSACVEGKLASKMEPSNEAYELACIMQGKSYNNLDQIRIYVLTDGRAKAKNFKDREVKGKTIKLEVMDIERLHRHWSEGKPRDDLIINFEEVSGSALPCIYIPGEMSEYDYALTVIPGEALRFLYEKYGPRLLEANVRSFLSITGKVNKGIRDTLRDEPERFLAYNNGIVVVVDEAIIGKTVDGGPGILGLKGMQIVNGGQTTASIYFSKKKNAQIDLQLVRVPAKIIVLNKTDLLKEEKLISEISKYSNSQNSVKTSDLSANKPYHVEIEKLSITTYCPNGEGRWFYERAAGSYKTMLAREGTTPQKLKRLKEIVVPSARKITKTDLAKYLHTWEMKPYLVSLGAQKNFQLFMARFNDVDEDKMPELPDVAAFKEMIAKAIIFKRTQTLVRPLFPAFQGNIVIYLVSILSFKLDDRINFEKIWKNQDISTELKNQLKIWSFEVNDVLNSSSNGKMISEWSKKNECWLAVKGANYSTMLEGIPEVGF